MDDDFGLSVVIDNHPRFMCEFILWAICSKATFPGRRRAYFIDCKPREVIEFAVEQGIDVRLTTTLLPASPHCNKIIPFLDPTGFGCQIVTDCDVYLMDDLTPFFSREAVRCAPNNHAVPPFRYFTRIFSEAGLSVVPEPGLALFMGTTRETYARNINGGVICIPRRYRHCAVEWLNAARWLARNPSLLGDYFIHIDQVSFVVMLERLGISFSFLPPQANTILQLLPEIETVIGLHITAGHIPRYANWFRGDGTLKWELINAKLSRVGGAFNAQIREAMAIIDRLTALQDFKNNFLNPAYRR